MASLLFNTSATNAPGPVEYSRDGGASYSSTNPMLDVPAGATYACVSRFVGTSITSNTLNITVPALVAPLFSDDFNRSAGPIGNGWVNVSGPEFQLDGNGKVSTGVSVATSGLMVHPSTSMTNGSIDIKVLNDLNCSTGIVFRYTSPTSFYLLDFGPGLSVTHQPEITFYRRTAAGFEVLKLILVEPNRQPAGELFSQTLLVNGNSFSLYNDTTLIYTFTDATYTGAGLCGMRGGNEGDGRRLVDSFVVNGS